MELIPFAPSAENSVTEDDNWQSPALPEIRIDSHSPEYADAIISDEWVSPDDPADYRMLTLAAPGRYRFELADLSGAAKLTLYTVSIHPRTGTRSLKPVRTITVAPRTVRSQRIDSGSLPALLLNAGTCYLAVQNVGKSETAYTVNATADLFIDADTSDDNWKTLGGDARIAVPGNQADFSGTLIDDNWVGYGNAIDYRELSLEAAGQYTFTLANLENTAKLSLFSVVTNARTGARSLRQLRTLTVVPRTVRGQRIDSGSLPALLLNAGTYYVAVQAPGASSGRNTGYSVRLDGDLFLKGDNADDRWQDAANWQTQHEIADWVGYGDAVDFRSFSIAADAAGVYKFTLGGDFNEVSLTLYRRNFDRNGKELAPVSLGTVANLKRDGQSGWNTLTKQLLAGDYYLAVKSTDNGRGAKNSDYTVSVTAEIFNTVTPGETLNLKLAARSSEMMTLNIAQTGQLTLKYAFGATYSLYRNVNNRLVAIALKPGLLLTAGTYYLKAANPARQTSTAHASLDFFAFPEARYGTPETAGDLGQVTGDALKLADWVGLDNGTDYYTFTTGDVGCLGEFKFSTQYNERFGRGSAAHDCLLKLSVGTVENGVFKRLAGKLITPADTLSLLPNRYAFQASLAANTTYFVRVETPDGGRGQFNSSYEAAFTPYLYSNDNRFETARQLGNLTDLSAECINATVAADDPVDYYHFSASGIYEIGVDDPSGAVRVSLYDRARRTLGIKTSTGWRSPAGTAVFPELSLDGDYFLKVENLGAVSHYRLRTRPCEVTDNNTVDAATDLGTTAAQLSASGWIGNADRADCWRFTLADEQRAFFSLQLANPAGSVLLTVWSGDEQIGNAFTATSDPFVFSSWQRELDAGTYVVKIEQLKGSSAYTLHGSFQYAYHAFSEIDALSGMDQAVTPQAAFAAGAALTPAEEARLAARTLIA